MTVSIDHLFHSIQLHFGTHDFAAPAEDGQSAFVSPRRKEMSGYPARRFISNDLFFVPFWFFIEKYITPKTYCQEVCGNLCTVSEKKNRPSGFVTSGVSLFYAGEILLGGQFERSGALAENPFFDMGIFPKRHKACCVMYSKLLQLSSPDTEIGIVEHIGCNKYVLSRSLYSAVGKPGTHTRIVGLDRETNKELLIKHIRAQGAEGTRLKELQQVLPSLNRSQIQVLLRELRREQRVHCVGYTSGARWFECPPPDESD